MAPARWKLLAAPLVITAVAIAGAAPVAADPEDLLPWCSGNQTPVNNDCRPAPSQIFTEDGPGADPQVPLGTDPGLQPAT
jgi:hypothetical protein